MFARVELDLRKQMEVLDALVPRDRDALSLPRPA